jgi:hypothetical protein
LFPTRHALTHLLRNTTNLVVPGLERSEADDTGAVDTTDLRDTTDVGDTTDAVVGQGKAARAWNATSPAGTADTPERVDSEHAGSTGGFTGPTVAADVTDTADAGGRDGR